MLIVYSCKINFKQIFKDLAALICFCPGKVKTEVVAQLVERLLPTPGSAVRLQSSANFVFNFCQLY